MKYNHTSMPVWLNEKGEKVACVEKIKVMQQNLEELKQMAQDAFEDGILMGIAPRQLKEFMIFMINSLNNPYQSKKE